MSESKMNIFMGAFKKTKLFDQLTRIEWLLGMFIVLPLAGTLGLTYLSYKNQEKTLECFQRIQERLVSIEDAIEVLLIEDTTTFNEYSCLSSSSSSSLTSSESSTPRLSLLLPQSVPLVLEEVKEEKLTSVKSNESFQGYHVVHSSSSPVIFSTNIV
jgi:hypothetical protein